jgi:tRNA G18 (ribose-2'-O)-methylase SpoU
VIHDDSSQQAIVRHHSPAVNEETRAAWGRFHGPRDTITAVPTVFVDDPADPRLADFRNLADADAPGQRGLFIVEGRLVVERLLLESPVEPCAVLVTEAGARALGPVLSRQPDLDVYVVPLALMEPLTGFNIHRGCLATARRPAARSIDDVLASGARRFLVLEGVTNPDNIGGLFRTARAFGVQAVVLGPGCGDPLYRKAVRVSCGAALVVPFAVASRWPDSLAVLGQHGVPIFALTPGGDCSLEDAAATHRPGSPLALMLGAEGPGLSAGALEAADQRVRIAIDPRADSLNVVVAAGVALNTLR